MKKIYKKNIYMFIIAIITVFFGCSNVKANDTACTESKLKTCYYKNPDNQLELRIKVVFYKSNEGLAGFTMVLIFMIQLHLMSIHLNHCIIVGKKQRKK